MPNNEQQIIAALSREVKTLQGRLREAAQNIYQMNIGIRSVSTLAAMYKAQLIECVNTLKGFDQLTMDQMAETVNKADKLLATSHMEPVNEILRLYKELKKANALTGAQVNMLQQLEQEIKHKDMKIAQLEQRN